MHRRIQIGKLPFIGRNLAVGMLKLFKEQHPQILFSEFWIDKSKSCAMKGEIPRCEPGILPFVGHGENPHRIQMTPMLIA